MRQPALVSRSAGPRVFGLFAGLLAVVGGVAADLDWVPIVVLVLICAAWVRSSVVRRRDLDLVVRALQRVADGDLTAEVPTVGSTEINAIGPPVERVVEQMREIMTLLKSSNKRLNVGWNEVNDVAWQMLQTSESAAEQASSAASAASHVSANMQVIAVATEELTSTVREMARNASEVSTDATMAAELVVNANTTINDLEAATKRVESVVELITAIAGQTRLLALNATIEAARAGDLGRGFTIVAGEVKQLALQTKSATDDVGQIVMAMQDGSTQATEAMGTVNDTIAKVSDNQQAIAAAVEQQTSAVNEIGQTAADAASGSGHLVDNINELVTAVRVTAYAGAQARTVASELADVETALADLTSGYRFKVSAESSAREVEEKTTAVVEGGVTKIRNSVFGTGLHEIDYKGQWRHSKQNLEADGTNSYSSMPGDTATLRFIGRRVRLFGFIEENHGMAAVSIDDGPETIIDQYGSHRECVKLYESPELTGGKHRLRMRVTGENNPDSRYIWVTLEHIEVDA